MRRIPLSVAGRRLVFDLGAPLAEVSAELDGFELKTVDVPDAPRRYLLLRGHGVELLFKEDVLAAVALHVDDQGAGVFRGAIDGVSGDVLVHPDEAGFVAALQALGFERLERRYPFAVDMLDAHLRMRLEQRPGNRMILIDDGARVR